LREVGDPNCASGKECCDNKGFERIRNSSQHPIRVHPF
jgi:hypothetical protein